ncbi:hypothetical protein QM012_001641 [Aureobasidium pullulans]|uniref:Ricin B lectin domain-containing protein n=1 Tax=Aureobasidium pullulans TaxID=5580 RepID=A0ABR0TFV2_AURPU
MRSVVSALAAFGVLAYAQSTSIDVDAISVPIPTSVFALPVVYVTKLGSPALTATTLASTVTGISDPSATDVFDSAADASAAIVSATIASSGLVKRDSTCVPQPTGISYNSNPDTAAAFAADEYYMDQSLDAQTPSGFVETFQNLTASNSADNYMGFTLLSSYDVSTCASGCSAITGCNSVNIYFERDPSVNPDSPNCSNPPSVINIKCVYWGGAVTAANANNFGQWRDDFQVLIAGSNGYVNSTYAAQLAGASSVSSSSAAASSTSASSTSASSTSASSTSASSTSASSTSASSTSASSTSASSTSASSTSASSTFTTITVPASSTTSTMLASSTSSSPSSSSTLTAPFYITIGNEQYVAVSSGQSEVTSFVSTITRATKFQLDKNTGYLLEASGSIGYAANLLTSSSNAQELYFNSVGQNNLKYLSCSQAAGSTLQCTADTNNKVQAAQVCSADNNSSLWSASSVDKNCKGVTLTYVLA